MPVNVKTFRHNPAILRREQSGSKVDLLCRLVLSASARWWKPPIYRRCVARDDHRPAVAMTSTAAERCRGSSAVFAVGALPNPGYALHYHLITSASARTGEGVSQRHFRIVVKADRGQPEQAARLRALLAPTEQAARVLALDHWMARGVALNARPLWRAEGRPAACLRRTCQRRISSGSKVICRSQAALTALVSRSHSILPPGAGYPAAASS